MPDPIHFLTSPKNDGLSVLTFTNRYKGKTTNRSWKLGWRGKLWQQRYYDHIVRTDENLHDIGLYILNNPLRKELVSKSDEWPWCGQISPLPDW